MVSDTCLNDWQEGWEGGKGEREEEVQRKDGRGKEVAWFPDNAVRVPNPLRSGKALCEVERLNA